MADFLPPKKLPEAINSDRYEADVFYCARWILYDILLHP